mgnify:CR=1 FL=1
MVLNNAGFVAQRLQKLEELLAAVALYKYLPKIADSAGRDDNMDIAKQCYIKAFSINPVAARDYYSRLDVDDMAYGALLESMVGTPNSTGSMTIYKNLIYTFVYKRLFRVFSAIKILYAVLLQNQDRARPTL